MGGAVKDDLKLLRQFFQGGVFVLNENITIRHPTLGEICDFGEEGYYAMATALCAYPSLYKTSLHDIGVDYTQITDFDFFCLMSKNMAQGMTAPLLGDLDLSVLELGKNMENDEMVLFEAVDGEHKCVIDRAIYTEMVGYLRGIHGFEKKDEMPADEYTKNYLIERERKRIARQRKTPFKSVLKPLISGMVNQPGFKYDYRTVWDLPIHIFNDSVHRTQKFLHYSNLMRGAYAGTVSLKEINKDDLNWLG